MQTLMAVNLQEIFSYELSFNFKLTSYIDVYIKERAITREGVNMPITMPRKHRMFHVVPCFLRMSSFFRFDNTFIYRIRRRVSETVSLSKILLRQ